MKRLITFVVFFSIPFIFMGCGDLLKKNKGGDPINLTLTDAPTRTDILVQHLAANAAGKKVPVLKAVTVAEFDANKSDPTVDQYVFIGRIPEQNSTSSVSSALGLGSLNLSIVSYELYLQPFRLRFVAKPYSLSATVPSGLTKTNARVFSILNGMLAYQQNAGDPTIQQITSNGLTPLCEFYSSGYTVLGWDLCAKFPQIQLNAGKRYIGLIYWTTPEDRALNRHQ